MVNDTVEPRSSVEREINIGHGVVKQLCDILDIDSMGLTHLSLRTNNVGGRPALFRIEASYLRLASDPEATTPRR